jgi:deazaflavin-dependent oxidoreductase (nitroreductase family)
MRAQDHPNHTAGAPMLMPPWLENFQIKFMNPVARRLAPHLPGFAMVHHRGRTSDTPYETVVSATRKDGRLYIGLVHGKTNWVKNVIAAGRADVDVYRGKVHITNPRVLPAGTEDDSLPWSLQKRVKKAALFVGDIDA